MTTDADLLQSYSDTRSEQAFEELIGRYINLVYSACLRQLRDRHLAEDATQAVFILLHQRAKKLRQDRISGWLLTACRYTCANIRKTERRRAHREQVVAMLENRNASQDAQGDQEILQMLDRALAHLNSMDREAVALRYFQQAPLAEVGTALGISEEAARKRVDRAVEKLRSYFVRHGISTSAVSLGALLPTQAHVAELTSSLTQSLTQSILQACHAGAASSAPAVAIAKGASFMMLMNTVKTVATATVAIALLIGAGWWGVSRRALAQPVAPIAAVAPAPAVPTTPLDLSTPEKTLESYCNAIKNSDRAGAYACTTADPNRASSSGDAFLSLNLSVNHMIRAAGKAFGTTGAEARQFPTLDLIISQVLAYDRLTGQSAVITGDTATLPFDLPDTLVNSLPAEVQKEVRSFTGHPIHFVKDGSNWKLGTSLMNPGKQIEVTITLTDTNKHPVNDPDLQIKVIQQYAAIYDRTADGIDAGIYSSWDDANTNMRSEIEKLHQKYNLSDINIQLVRAPESEPK